MYKRVVPLLFVCAATAAMLIASGSTPANPPTSPAASDVGAATAAPAVKTAASRVSGVTVYPNSALITREVDVPEGTGTMELTVTPLPPATAHNSLYTEGSEGLRVLTTRFRARAILEDTREEVRKVQDELEQLQLAREKIEADIKANQGNEKLLTKLEGFTSVTTIQTTEKGQFNSDSAIAMSKYIMESRAANAKELVALQQQVQANQKKAEFAQRQLKELTSGTAKTQNDAVIVVEKSHAAAGKVRLNYLVDAASWRPQYKLRAGLTPKDKVQIEYLASVTQHTGEDWSNVNMVLSTAKPMLNAAPPELQVLNVSVVPNAQAQGQQAVRQRDLMEIEDEVRSLRMKAEKDFNEKKQSSGVGLYNTAAALDQGWELLNPEAAVLRGCALAVREGPTVTHHLTTKLSVPSRNDEQIFEVARLEMTPDYYYKAVPLLTTQVYRLADMTNRSKTVILPGEATMYIGSDFVGQMSMPLVAIGEAFTVGFGVDPQLQVQRQMINKDRTTLGGNQSLRYEYRILVNSYKSEPVKLQVWDRLPFAENKAVNVSLLKTEPELSKDGLYLREQRNNNLLRWDVTVEPNRSGEKALALNYEFKLELDRQMTISSFQTAGVFTPPMPNNPDVRPAPQQPQANQPLPPMSSNDMNKIRTNMMKLSPEDRKIAEAQVFCAIDQDSPLGSTGPIFKVMIKGQPVFLCCRGCESEAKAHPDETLQKLQALLKRVGGRR